MHGRRLIGIVLLAVMLGSLLAAIGGLVTAAVSQAAPVSTLAVSDIDARSTAQNLALLEAAQ